MRKRVSSEAGELQRVPNDIRGTVGWVVPLDGDDEVWVDLKHLEVEVLYVEED